MAKNIRHATNSARKVFFLSLGIIIIGISGCTSTPAENVTAPTPSETPEFTTFCSIDTVGPWGDVVAKEDITDEYGTYCHTTKYSASENFIYDSAKVDLTSLEKLGFTEEDAISAQEKSITFVTEEVLDSIVLDSPSSELFDKWVTTNEELFSGDWDVKETTGVVYREELPQLIRDGNPRIAKTTLVITSINAQESTNRESVPILVVKTSSTANYRVTDENAISFLLANGYTGTRESLVSEQLALADGIENILAVNVFYAVGYDHDGKISGVAYEYTPDLNIFNNLIVE